ncbi:DUF3106 domain-containing protein [Polynucleobacter ibericus]|uniref:DUF3106 domain-containing protein n=1 Tax=Polynucleobacter ibericus TaxID=1819725 RepID=UPI001BFD88B2|nr:DUF3106 domain-containing protein [Polynucleobacter ibericus]QWE07845.1 DUF3106 domain-containing protein [Polynucleobacter ibericus]
MSSTTRTQKVCSLALLAFCLSVQAQPAPSASTGKPAIVAERKPDGTWEGLKPAQQKILAPLESDWDYMLPDSRKKWTQVANIYPKMSAQDQERLQSRMAGWSNLSQKERRLARENYLASLKFPAEKKAEAWSAYQKLSDEQKKKLAESEVKKKPTAANAPTLQQHPISPKATLPSTGSTPSQTAPVESTGSNAESAPTNN